MNQMQTKAQQHQDQQAKMARAYIVGGMPPYQAARKTGFLRVAVMQEAIRAMESREQGAESVADTVMEPQGYRALKPSTPCPAASRWDAPRETGQSPKPVQEWVRAEQEARPTREACDWVVSGAGFTAKRLPACGELPACVRLTSASRPLHYLQFPADKLLELLTTLTAAVDMDNLMTQKKEETPA